MAAFSGGISYFYGSLKASDASQNSSFIGSREDTVEELILKFFN
jgi:hypothetical protein